DPETHRGTAVSGALTEHWAVALQESELARDLARGDETLALLRGFLRVQAGRAAEALPDLEEYLARHPNDREARGLRGQARLAAGRRDEALADLREAASARG